MHSKKRLVHSSLEQQHRSQQELHSLGQQHRSRFRNQQELHRSEQRFRSHFRSQQERHSLDRKVLHKKEPSHSRCDGEA